MLMSPFDAFGLDLDCARVAHWSTLTVVLFIFIYTFRVTLYKKGILVSVNYEQ